MEGCPVFSHVVRGSPIIKQSRLKRQEPPTLWVLLRRQEVGEEMTEEMNLLESN